MLATCRIQGWPSAGYLDRRSSTAATDPRGDRDGRPARSPPASASTVAAHRSTRPRWWRWPAGSARWRPPKPDRAGTPGGRRHAGAPGPGRRHRRRRHPADADGSTACWSRVAPTACTAPRCPTDAAVALQDRRRRRSGPDAGAGRRPDGPRARRARAAPLATCWTNSPSAPCWAADSPSARVDDRRRTLFLIGPRIRGRSPDILSTAACCRSAFRLYDKGVQMTLETDRLRPATRSRHHYHHPSPEETESHLQELFSEEEQGYHKGLKPRQIQMIAIGGAIGTGLFLGRRRPAGRRPARPWSSPTRCAASSPSWCCGPWASW